MGMKIKPIDPYKRLKTDTEEINQKRNILAALVNLKTQLGDHINTENQKLQYDCLEFIPKYDREIEKLRGRKK